MNLDTMESSYTYIEIESGNMIEYFKLYPKFQLMNIRQIELGLDSDIALAMKSQGPKIHLFPSAGFKKGSEETMLVSCTKKIIYNMKNYFGSVVFDSTSGLIAFSSSLSEIITFCQFLQKKSPPFS